MIYLDNNATTQPLPEVIATVEEVLHNNWGNPSSSHAFGKRARETLESSRGIIAHSFGASDPSRLIFSASGTEAINLAFACLLSPHVQQILLPPTEHSAVLRAAKRWANGRPVVCIPVDANGLLDLDFLESQIKNKLSLVSVGFANNETGIISDISSVSSICQEGRALLHVDAVQAAGKVPLDLDSLECSAASLSAHKFHAPAGCGVLYLSQPPNSDAQNRIPAPGHQESGLRSGTENLPSIVGCGVAANLIQEFLDSVPFIERIRDQLEATLLSEIPGSQVHGRDCLRLPNTTSLYCPKRNASDLVEILSDLGLAVSAGAACSNGGSPSHVIKAMGFSNERANSTLRLSLSHQSISEEIEAAAKLVIQAYKSTIPIPE